MLMQPTSTFFFFNDTATTEIYTLSLHDALPIWPGRGCSRDRVRGWNRRSLPGPKDRKSTRLNSSHSQISYAVFCLKKKIFAKTWKRTSDSDFLGTGRQLIIYCSDATHTMIGSVV